MSYALLWSCRESPAAVTSSDVRGAHADESVETPKDFTHFALPGEQYLRCSDTGGKNRWSHMIFDVRRSGELKSRDYTVRDVSRHA